MCFSQQHVRILDTTSHCQLFWPPAYVPKELRPPYEGQSRKGMAADQGGPNWGAEACSTRTDSAARRTNTSKAPSSQIAAAAVVSPRQEAQSGAAAPSLPGIDYVDQFLPDNFFESARRRNAPGPFAVPSFRPETSAWRSTSSSPSSERTDILMTEGSGKFKLERLASKNR